MVVIALRGMIQPFRAMRLWQNVIESLERKVALSQKQERL